LRLARLSEDEAAMVRGLDPRTTFGKTPGKMSDPPKLRLEIEAGSVSVCDGIRRTGRDGGTVLDAGGVRVRRSTSGNMATSATGLQWSPAAGFAPPMRVAERRVPR
jgi:hypothetical protein